MNLRRGKADAAGIVHGRDHVVDEGPDVLGGRIGDLFGLADQNRVAHTGDLKQCHAANIGG